MAANLETICSDRAREIITMNRQGEKPLSLLEDNKAKPQKKSADLLADADVCRFDKAKKKKGNNSKRNKNRQEKDGMTAKNNNRGNGAEMEPANAAAVQQPESGPRPDAKPQDGTPRQRRNGNGNAPDGDRNNRQRRRDRQPKNMRNNDNGNPDNASADRQNAPRPQSEGRENKTAEAGNDTQE